VEEFERIASLQARLQASIVTQPPREASQTPLVKVGIGDDAAVFTTDPETDSLVTTDSMVEGIHFLPETLSWYDVGYKCLAASISDIAAMGGQPTVAVMALAVPKDLPMAALEAMYDGIGTLAARFGCQVAGGDLVGTNGPVVITSTVFGSVPKGSALLRSGARCGDILFVTGALGGSAAGLELLTGGGVLPDDERAVLQGLHQRPLPQITAGQILRECGASSCNDISDGLASECNEIAHASGVRLRIEKSRIPMPPAAVNLARWQRKDAVAYALYGGEDYQLTGTAAPLAFAAALARCESVGIRLTAIGRVESGDGVVSEAPDGHLEVVEPKGYNHFS
jgi:thiamine-monophosphate kinase